MDIIGDWKQCARNHTGCGNELMPVDTISGGGLMIDEHQEETKSECGIRCEEHFNDCVEHERLKCLEEYDSCRSSCEDIIE
jgi:hypothetical protein